MQGVPSGEIAPPEWVKYYNKSGRSFNSGSHGGDTLETKYHEYRQRCETQKDTPLEFWKWLPLMTEL